MTSCCSIQPYSYPSFTLRTEESNLDHNITKKNNTHTRKKKPTTHKKPWHYKKFFVSLFSFTMASWRNHTCRQMSTRPGNKGQEKSRTTGSPCTSSVIAVGCSLSMKQNTQVREICFHCIEVKEPASKKLHHFNTYLSIDIGTKLQKALDHFF